MCLVSSHCAGWERGLWSWKEAAIHNSGTVKLCLTGVGEGKPIQDQGQKLHFEIAKNTVKSALCSSYEGLSLWVVHKFLETCEKLHA